ncbi:MAG: hypothetical protein ACI4S2_12380 [Lachnospiraceae bacterium]
MAALTKITDNELLKEVKTINGYSSYSDPAIKLLIEDVKYTLEDAGVHEVAINSRAAIGVIARGVDDMWTLGGGTASLSPLFKERAAQLALKYPKSDNLSHAESEAENA